MLTVLNDVHIGAIRVAGTTPTTKLALQAHLLSQFKALLPNSDLMILGDLFDTHDTNIYDVYQTYKMLSRWADDTEKKLYLVAGNHDISKTSTTFSSFEMLCNLLKFAHPNVTVIMTPQMTPHGYVIPHLPNQAAFDKALESVPECDVLYLHVNYNNSFAAQSDQSLNLTAKQAEACPAKQIVIAHEHNYKVAGKVTLPGNQVASSVSDWVNSPSKSYVTVTNGTVEVKHVRHAIEEYVELPWKLLEITSHKFVRVVGTATSEEATQVVSAIAKFRQISPALVVSNAVEIALNDDSGDFAASLEAAQGFDVWQALEAHFTASEVTKLRALT
jgi:predicted phosphodiesterase